MAFIFFTSRSTIGMNGLLFSYLSKKKEMKKIFLLFLVTFLMSLFGHSQPNRAFLIIDIQEFYFPGGDAELIEPSIAAANAGEILGHFREKGELVVHIRHNYEPGGNIHELVKPMDGEKVISKNYANGFRETELHEYLTANGISQLIIAGMQTHMCVEATTRAAADKGYSCIVISDACTTRDLKYGDKQIGWEEVHYSTLATLKGSYAAIMTTGDFLRQDQKE